MDVSGSDVILELYRQAWHQSRHNELLRASTGVVYLAVVAAILGLTADIKPDDGVMQQIQTQSMRWVWMLLTLVSIFSSLLSFRFTANAERWTRLQKRIQHQARSRIFEVGIDASDVAPAKGWLEKTTGLLFLRAKFLIPLANFLGLLLFLSLAVFSFVET